MRGDLLGGGVVVAVAAALWLIYLVPTWLHRREYLATERNAVRLQQTLRILAETAETPREVHVEATAREVARQRKALKNAQRAVAAEARKAAEREARVIAERELREEREAAATQAQAVVHARAVAQAQATARAQATASTRMVPADQTRVAAQAAAEHRVRVGAPAYAAPAPTAVPVPALTPAARPAAALTDRRRSARVRRRMRAAGSLALLASLAVIVWGVVAVATGTGWPVLAGGIAMFGCAVVALRRLARLRTRNPVAAATVAPSASELFDQADHEAPAAPRAASTWTPRPLPKPLHLSRGTVAASAMASVDAAVELRRAAARAELERRAESVEPELPRLRPAASTPRPVPEAERQVVAATGTDDRYAAMGVVDGVGDGRLDLDAVLRRRRG